MKYSYFDFVRDQRKGAPKIETADLTGRTVLIVGANVGIGFEAAKHFARMKAGRLILGCRNEAKGQAAISAIEKVTGYTKAELWLIDNSDFSSVTAFVEKFEKDGGRLDILVLNAAILAHTYEATPDKWELSLQVNYLAPALLSLLLLPHLLKSAQDASATPRLIFVSSDVHYWTEISSEAQECPNLLEKIGSQEYCTPSVMSYRYSTTKLLGLFFVRAFNMHISPSTPLVVNAANPQYCYSEFRRSLTSVVKVLDWFMEKALALTAEEGSRQLVYAAVGGKEDESKMRGAYITTNSTKEVSDFVLSEEGGRVQNRIWGETIDILSQISPKVKDIVDEYLLSNSKMVL